MFHLNAHDETGENKFKESLCFMKGEIEER